MGIVYLAHDPELDRNVALKFVRSLGGRSAERRRARMLREARAMACLSHRNVVGVLDVGLHTGPGCPQPLLFIAMEYVDAESLTAWLRRQRSSAEILRVFLAAGHGLAAAHAAGLVHRDFKPDNVLVGARSRSTAKSGERRRDLEVKVTDFGLACASGSTHGGAVASPDGELSSSSTEVSDAVGLGRLTQGRLTRTGAATGTPAYMAPEQHLRQTVDQRADQFAFCVALYEALYNQSPFGGSSADEKARAVLAGDVLRPQRATGLERRVWPALLRGLQKRPAERWPSMDALLHALEKAARPPRPSGAVLAGGAIAVVVGGAWVQSVLSTKPGRCSTSEGELEGIWDDARRERVHAAVNKTSTRHAAETWSRLSSTLESYATSWQTVYAQICDPSRPVDEVGSTYDRAMACMADRRSRLEALLDLLDQADDQTVSAAVRAASSLPSVSPCADAEALSAEVAPPQDEATRARVRSIRTDLANADTLVDLGRVHEAVEVLERTFAAAERIEYPPVVAETLLLLGTARALSGEAQQGRSELERAYFIATESSDALTATRAAIALARVAGLLMQDAEAALEWARHARAGLARLHDDGTLEGSLLTIIGHVHHDRNELEQARTHHERALEIMVSLHGPDHIESAKALNSMGVFWYRTGEFDQAADTMSRALRAHEQALGPSHPTVGAMAGNLGLLARKRGDLDLALGYFERSVEVLEKAYGAMHFELAAPLNNIALVQQQRGDCQAALRTLERALAIARKTHGDEHPRIALLLANVAFARLGDGDPAAAEEPARRAATLYESILGAEHPRVSAPLALLAESLLEQGRPAEAIVAAERALAVHAPGEPVLWVHDALARWVLARALVDTEGDSERALHLAAAAAERYDAADEPAFSRSDEIREWLQSQTESP